MPPMQMVHQKDPAQLLLDKLGSLKDVDVFNNQVCVAVYERPAQTQGGIHIPDKTRDEEQWQGKACLVVAMGPTAFNDSEGRWFQGDAQKVALGEWVVIRPSDGFPIKINKVPCRIVNDTAIRMRISHPDRVW